MKARCGVRVRHSVAWTLFFVTIGTGGAWVCAPPMCAPPFLRYGGSTALQAKGFGNAKSKAGSSPNQASTVSAKSMLKQVQKKYGGTTAQEIALGTQRLMDAAQSRLPPHLQMATTIYQQLCQWQAKVEKMSILEQANLSPSDVDGARRAQAELDRLYQEHNLTATDLHNVLQQLTWDASADAKVARSLTGTMSVDVTRRIERACAYVSDAVLRAENGRCLDVGCGFGTLVPILRRTLPPSSIYGLDLSPEMIRHARLLYPDGSFDAGDFLQYPIPDQLFDAIIFCSALHDLPDVTAALNQAAALLQPGGGCLVIVHAQGARHVQGQVEANPVLVPRALPEADELRTLVDHMTLTVEPAPAGTPGDVRDGYLAVLTKL